MSDPKNKFFWCAKRKLLNCPVSITLDIASDKITRITGEHNHDSGLVEEAVKDQVVQKIEDAVQNHTVAPHAAFMSLTNTVMSHLA